MIKFNRGVVVKLRLVRSDDGMIATCQNHAVESLLGGIAYREWHQALGRWLVWVGAPWDKPTFEAMASHWDKPAEVHLFGELVLVVDNTPGKRLRKRLTAAAD